MDNARSRYIAQISQPVMLIPHATYRPSPWSALDPLVPRHVEDEDRRATEGDLDWIRHVELARLHDRGHRGDELAARMAGLSDRRGHVVNFRLFDPPHDRGGRLLPQPTLLGK